jgi:hypothetical protein
MNIFEKDKIYWVTTKEDFKLFVRFLGSEEGLYLFESPEGKRVAITSAYIKEVSENTTYEFKPRPRPNPTQQ